MADKIRVLVIDPEEGIKERHVPNTLETFQELVGGHIEVMPYFTFLFVMDEEGKLKGKAPNMIVHGGLDTLCGTVVAVGQCNEEFCSLSDREVAVIKTFYEVNKVEEPEIGYFPFLNVVTE